MAIMGYMGYRKRTGFLAGLTVAQISEFSIIFTAMGISLGHIEAPTLGLVTLVGLVTITLSTYMILYSQPLYARLAPWLGYFERQQPFREMKMEQGVVDATDGADVIVFGAGRFGCRLITQLRALGFEVLAVDFDPEAVQDLRRKRVPVRFGDAEDMEFAASLPLAQAQWVVSTLPEAHVNLVLILALREHGFSGKVAVALRGTEDREFIDSLGADRVFRPYDDAADYAAEELAQTLVRNDELPLILEPGNGS